VILITSGAFISAELQAELGQLPPSFLPLGNRRLYEHQAANIRGHFGDIDIFLSVTETYKIQTSDWMLLEELGITVIPVPNGLSLGESVLNAINRIGRYYETIRILHGDTLIMRLPLTGDLIALAMSNDDYPWEVESRGLTAERVWCGYFAFSDVKLLVRSLSRLGGNFVDAVRTYQSIRTLSLDLVEGWYDLGHVNTYFRSRASLTTQRIFNDLRIEDGVVRKSGKDSHKIEAERLWFQTLPDSLKRFVPQLISHGSVKGSPFYELEYLPLMPLNELFVHCCLPASFWSRIFILLRELMERFGKSVQLDMTQRQQIANGFYHLVVTKTRCRLNEFQNETGCDLHQGTTLNGVELPSIFTIADRCQQAVLKLCSVASLVHGDLCFSNLLFDSRTEQLKVIDPRGLDASGKFSSLGDLKYDFAKIAHSIVGLYDHIVSGRYTLENIGPMDFKFSIYVDTHTLALQAFFVKEFRLNGLTVSQIMPLVVLLFLSMLPLHHDNPRRQQAFIANALRLFREWSDR
jgi:hypothetical protein